jgi:hypothetical protein
MAAVLGCSSSSPSSPSSSFAASLSRRNPARPFQRAQRLGLGFAHQAAMNHGLAVAVDGDDGTGCGLHVRAVVLQAIFQRLQLLAHGFAFLLQGIGLFLVLGVQRGIHGGQFVHLGLQLLDALRFALVRFAALLGARWKACRSAWVTPGVASTHAQPSAAPRRRCLPACLAPAVPAARHRSDTRPHRLPRTGRGGCHRLRLRRCPAHEAHQRMPVGVDFALGQAVAQVGRVRCHCGAS